MRFTRKCLNLPLSYYTEARKGDVIARISSDVQEIEDLHYEFSANALQGSHYHHHLPDIPFLHQF